MNDHLNNSHLRKARIIPLKHARYMKHLLLDNEKMTLERWTILSFLLKQQIKTQAAYSKFWQGTKPWSAHFVFVFLIQVLGAVLVSQSCVIDTKRELSLLQQHFSISMSNKSNIIQLSHCLFTVGYKTHAHD